MDILSSALIVVAFVSTKPDQSQLPDEPRVRELVVRPHSLELYDAVGCGVEEVTL